MNLSLENDYFNILKHCPQEDPSGLYFRWGYYCLTESKEFDKAIAIFINGLSHNRVSPLAWLYLGKSYFFSKEFSKAESALSQANIYDPNNTEIWAYLVLSALHLSQIPKANQSLKEFFKLDYKRNI